METLSKAKLKLFTSLHQKKYRYEHALFLAEGKKLVEEGLSSNWAVSCVLINDARKEGLLADLTSYQGIPHYLVAAKDFDRLSTQVHGEGIMAVVGMPANQPYLITPTTSALLLEKVQDPGNLGTLLRTADWFGIQRVYCSADTVDLFNPKVLRSSMGAVFRCECIYVEDWDSFLVQHQTRIWLAHMDGSPLRDHHFLAGEWILLGNEANGVSAETRKSFQNRMLTIPRRGKGESLNVGIAGGIFMHHLSAANS